MNPRGLPILQTYNRTSTNAVSSVFVDMLSSLIAGDEVYVEVSSLRSRRMAIKDITGSIGFIKSICLTYRDKSKVTLSSETSDPTEVLRHYKMGSYFSNRNNGWTEIKLTVGFKGRSNKITFTSTETDALVWLDGYAGETNYINNKAKRDEKKKNLVENAKDAFGAEIGVDDILIYYLHGSDEMGVGIVTGIEARTRYQRIEPVIKLRSIFDADNTLQITAFNRVVKLTDRLKNDVMLKKLMHEGGALTR